MHLKEEGYQERLPFDRKVIVAAAKEKKSRKRDVLWYNPPFSSNVRTNIGHKFLNIIKNEFGPRHQLRKIFNKNTLKIVYSCMDNMKNHRERHNKLMLNNSETSASRKHECNCRDPNQCPLEGE